MFFTSKSPLSFHWTTWFHLRSPTSSNLSQRLILGSFHHSTPLKIHLNGMDKSSNSYTQAPPWRFPFVFFIFFQSENLPFPIINLWKEAFWYHLLNLSRKHHEIHPTASLCCIKSRKVLKPSLICIKFTLAAVWIFFFFFIIINAKDESFLKSFFGCIFLYLSSGGTKPWKVPVQSLLHVEKTASTRAQCSSEHQQL